MQKFFCAQIVSFPERNPASVLNADIPGSGAVREILTTPAVSR